MNGPGIIEQARLRPVTSTVPQGVGVGAQANGQGIGISYGAGTGMVRATGLKWSTYDLQAAQAMNAGGAWRIRLVILSGDYSPGALSLTPTTDLTSWDPLLDQIIESQPSGQLETWYSPMVSDDGQAMTAMVSGVLWLSGSGPPGIQPVTRLHLLGDYAKRFRGGPFEE